jgi:hypothetical protein
MALDEQFDKKEVSSMSFWAHAMGEPKSVIDRNKGTITLRTRDYPKTGYWELILSGTSVVFNKTTRKGVVTEIIQLPQISEMVLDLAKTGISGHFTIRGTRPKLWVCQMDFSGPDMFVAYEAYAYILAQRINDTQNPIKHAISPVLVGMKQQLDNGELDNEALRAKGVHF